MNRLREWLKEAGQVEFGDEAGDSLEVLVPGNIRKAVV